MPKNNAAKKGKKVGNKGKEPMGKKDKVAEQPKVRLSITRDPWTTGSTSLVLGRSYFYRFHSCVLYTFSTIIIYCEQE